MKQGWEISLSLCHEEYRLLKYDDDPKDRFRHDAKYFKGVKL